MRSFSGNPSATLVPNESLPGVAVSPYAQDLADYITRLDQKIVRYRAEDAEMRPKCAAAREELMAFKQILVAQAGLPR